MVTLALSNQRSTVLIYERISIIQRNISIAAAYLFVKNENGRNNAHYEKKAQYNHMLQTSTDKRLFYGSTNTKF